MSAVNSPVLFIVMLGNMSTEERRVHLIRRVLSFEGVHQQLHEKRKPGKRINRMSGCSKGRCDAFD